jgi:hypothetical protein
MVKKSRALVSAQLKMQDWSLAVAGAVAGQCQLNTAFGKHEAHDCEDYPTNNDLNQNAPTA